ncbi:uncharacterized protein LOC131675570 isoform X2 [Phymastichus coffea]|uniref:uncharacterized protein LOC131675570 isoform X2 n=1 Tax=Phymastichus coffea TaxID=108790 RepID=UPI00273B432F|nr:uncharacterized protein LOC131675570 isoform X2 [Phymastichus coffea]
MKIIRIKETNQTSKFTKSYMPKSCYDITIHKEVSALQNKKLNTRSSLINLLNAVKEQDIYSLEYSLYDDVTLLGQSNTQRKIERRLKHCIDSENDLIDESNHSFKPSSSLQNSFVTNIFKFGLVNKDSSKQRCEANNVQCQISTLSKSIPNSETSSSYSYNKQTNFTLSQKIKNTKIQKVPKISVDQYTSAISSESDLSSCTTPIINTTVKSYSYRKTERKISRSLSQSPRRVQDHSYSNESSCSLTSTIPRDRRSFSYSSRSSVSSRLSRYILSESSKSRSPSIPRRYGSPSFLERRRITRVTGYNSEFVIMKDMATKIAELKFEAPLACFEEEDTSAIKNRNIFSDQLVGINIGNNYIESPNCNTSRIPDNTDTIHDGAFSPFSGSLEDLVNTFDEKITSCFKDYGTNVESLAPVQVRTQEEIMNECQMWWTITGTFGNILPIDWNKSYARKMHVPTLNLNDAIKPSNGIVLEDLSSEDEAVATDLDMHALILSSRNENYNIEEPVKTADEVLREIDDIMQESPVDESFHSECFLEINEALERSKEVLSSPLHEKRLEQYSSKQLLEFLSEMDSLISALSESLINELALRDELEYEKELKNQFISLLLAVQNRRRQHHVAKKRNQSQTGSSPLPQQKSFHESKYLTTVIPYHTDNGNLDNQALQVLIKILKAINEDSPAVPALLTDYILKVLCPT